MGSVRLDENALDTLLSLQISVAWAGEARSDPKRLGWWQTDLFDEGAGGDLFARLVPRTHAWAKLEALREAARRVDERTRLRTAEPERTLSLYHLGFDVDEALNERIATHRRAGRAPESVLTEGYPLTTTFDRLAFESWCKGFAKPSDATEPTPDGGRRLLNPPTDTVALARALVSSLAPFPSEYPMPHARVERGAA